MSLSIIVEREVGDKNSPSGFRWNPCFEREISFEQNSCYLSTIIEVLHVLFASWKHRIIIKSE